MQTCRRSFLKQVKSTRIESNRVESLQLAVLVKSARPGVTLPAWRHFKTASAAADSFASWFDWDKGFHIHRYIKICMFVCVYVCSGLAHLFYLMGVAWTNLLPAVANLFQCQVNHSNYSNIDVPPSMSQLSSIYLFLSLSSLLHLRHAWTKGNAKLKENAIRLTKVLVFLLNKWRSLFWITLTSD